MECIVLFCGLLTHNLPWHDSAHMARWAVMINMTNGEANISDDVEFDMKFIIMIACDIRAVVEGARIAANTGHVAYVLVAFFKSSGRLARREP